MMFFSLMEELLGGLGSEQPLQPKVFLIYAEQDTGRFLIDSFRFCATN